MKRLLFLPLAAASAADFAVWNTADLKSYEKTLHEKLDADRTANQQIADYEGHAVYVVHREGTGPAEAHNTVAHLIYVISGKADLVVGGKMVDEKVLGPEMIRSSSVTGGETKKIVTGDVVHIQPKASHWFKVAPGSQITYLMINLDSK